MTDSKPQAWNRLDVLFGLVAALTLTAFRVHAVGAPLESDECNYAYFCVRMLAGDQLYVDLWDHQPPGIYALLLIPTAIFGSAPMVYRALALAATTITLLFLFDIGRRAWGRPGAWTVAAVFAISSSDPGMAGEGCNREIYMNPLIVAAWWMLMTHHAKRGLGRLALAGLLLGAASLIKTVVAAHWVAMIPVILIGARPRWTSSIKGLVVYAAGPVLLWGGVLLYFSGSGRMAVFVDAVFTYNLRYSDVGIGWLDRLIAFFGTRGVFGSAAALWVFGGLGLVVLPWKRNTELALGLACLFIGSLVAVCLPGRFWHHYYLLMLPALALAAAGVVYRLAAYRTVLGAPAGVFIVLALLATEIPHYWLIDPDHIAGHRYGQRMTWVRDQARRVAAVTDPADTIYVWSTDAGFYYYGARRCASRFTMSGPLTTNHSSATQRLSLLITDLAKNAPRLVLLPEPPAEGLERFLKAQGYTAVGEDPGKMLILCDPSRPIARIEWEWNPTP